MIGQSLEQKMPSKIIYNGSVDPVIKNSLLVYKDRYSWINDNVMETEYITLDYVDVYDIYVIFGYNRDEMMTWFKKEGDDCSGYTLLPGQENGTFILDGNLYEWHHNNDDSEISVYVESISRYTYSYIKRDELTMMINDPKVIMPKRIYSKNWPDLKITRNMINDISVICSE